MKIYFRKENSKLPTLKIFLIICNIINMHKKEIIKRVPMANEYFCASNFPIMHKSHWSSTCHNLILTFGIKTSQNNAHI